MTTISASSFGAGTNSTLGTGIDVTSTVSALMVAARAPETTWENEITTNTSRISALNSVVSELDTLENDLTTLRDTVTGAFSTMTASSSNSSVVTATATGTASATTHSIAVSQLATTSSVYTNAVDSSTTLSDGTFSFTVGGASKSVDITSSDNTLSTLASAINNADLGVTASVVSTTSGSILSMVSNTSGTEGAIAVTSAPTGLTFNTGVTAQDAKLTVDGVPLTESSNTLSGVITGVTLNLWGTNSTAASLSVTSDTTTIASDISSFVTDYNTVISAINSQYTADASGNEGVLAGDTSLEQVQSQLLSMLSSQYTGDSTSTYTTLTSLGITMNNDGTLSVNSTTLETALSDNTSAVKDFFTNTSGGFATSMYTSLKTITNTSTGALTMDVNGLTESNTALKKDISDFEVRMVAMQSSLTAEYDEINVEMEQYPSSLSSVSTILSSLSTTS